MKLSERIRKWKGNLTTQTPVEYVLTLRADVNGFADEAKALERENAKLRAAVATAIRVQTVLCGDADMAYCRESCPLHRQETDDCVACDVIRVAHEFGICEGEE